MVLQEEFAMKLFSLALSPYAARVRVAVHAKKLPVEIVSPPSDWRTSPEFRKLNPLVRVPVLVLDDGTALAESGVIVEYLEDTYPETSLRPRSPKDLARVRFITQVGEHYVMPSIMPLFGLFDTKARDEAAITAQLAKLDAALKQLNDLLPPGTYASGDQLTTADAWLTPLRYSLEGLMNFSGRTQILDRHDAVRAYADVARRDAHLGRVWREMDDGLKGVYGVPSGERLEPPLPLSLLREAHADSAEPAVDMKNLSGNTGREVRAQERGRVADVLECHIPAHGGYFGDPVQHFPKAGNACRGERLDGPRGDAVHTDATWPQVRGHERTFASRLASRVP